MGILSFQTEQGKIRLQFFDSQTWRYPLQSTMIVNFAKIMMIPLFWKIIEIHLNWRYLLMTLQNNVLEFQLNHHLCNLLISKLSIHNHCFQGSHLSSYQTYFNRSSLVLILGIKKVPFWRSKITNSSWSSIRAIWRGVFRLPKVEFIFVLVSMKN